MDISAFRDRPMTETLTVSELNNLIKGIFDSNRLLASVSIKGEISNFKAHSSGHLYFSLKDEGGQIRAVMFRSQAASLRFVPENGMRVIVTGSVSVYPRDGSYQLYAGSMQPDGIGALYLAYEQMKARLEEDGLFSHEHKRPIPAYPERVGVITSPTGAAVRDIINVITRRSPATEIYLYPALVQGDGAERSLINGIRYFEREKCVDTVIIGRGGGSIEDLWAFNSEALARCIYSATVPIISAVGHETDFTIADFVADLRAPTPSAAAELAVPDSREVGMRLLTAARRCDSVLSSVVTRAAERLNALKASEVYTDPMMILSPYSAELSDRLIELSRSYSLCLSAGRASFAALVGKLEALSPLSVLTRGYAIAEKNGRAITDVKDVLPGDGITVRLRHGEIDAKVTSVR